MCYTPSIFFPDLILVNQYIDKKKACDHKCPKDMFKKQLTEMLASSLDDRICYCYTHRKIIGYIIKNCEVVWLYKSSPKSLRRVGRQLFNVLCRGCPRYNLCKSRYREKEIFFAVVFRKRNVEIKTGIK